MTTDTRNEKRNAFKVLYEKGVKVRVFVDNTRSDVTLPDHLPKGDVPLDFSRAMQIPVQIHPGSLVATLSFNRKDHKVRIPWDAVRAIGFPANDGKGNYAIRQWELGDPPEVAESTLEALGESLASGIVLKAEDPPSANTYLTHGLPWPDFQGGGPYVQ